MAMHRSPLWSTLLVKLNERTHRTHALPIVMYAPTSRCNSRCVSCDWWKTDGASDLARHEVEALARELPGLGTRLVVFTGGEPLVREDVFALADLFLAQGLTLHLLTSGLALERHAREVADRFSEVTVSLDGSTAATYRAVRGVDGLGALERGIRRLRELRPDLPVRARSTLHRASFRQFPDLVAAAQRLGLDAISFLAADVASGSFGREASGALRPHALLLEPSEIEELERLLDEAAVRHASAFASGLVVEDRERLRRLPAYYRAQRGLGPFPKVSCNAPWASVVVESDGRVRPCFFHAHVGSIREQSLRAILDGPMVRFRRGLDVARDATCQRCVCSARLGVRREPW